MEIVFNEATGKYEAHLDPAPSQPAEMEQSGMAGSLGRFSNLEIMGVPLGAAAVGGISAIVLDRVVLERLDPAHKYSPYSLLVASALIGRFGRKYAGDAAKYMSLILAYEGVADFLSAAVDKVWPKTIATTAQSRAAAAAQAGSPAAGDYYSQAFRR